MDNLHAQVQLLWDNYWRNFDEAAILSRRNDKSSISIHTVRKEFAEHTLRDFRKLEQEFLDRTVDTTTLLLYDVGMMLYGDAGDDRSALKYLRQILSNASLKKEIIESQIFAIEMTLHTYEQNQVELAYTLSLINIGELRQKDIIIFRRFLVTAIKSHFHNQCLEINKALFAELSRLLELPNETDSNHHFGDIFSDDKYSSV